jgi:hypothetical protein
MSATIESAKRLNRQVVVPFDGEENFVVPKKGGFGQPDNEHYVMVTGDGYAYATAPTTIGGTPTSPAPSPSTNTQVGTDVGTTTSTSSPTQVGTSASTTVTGASTPSSSTTQSSGQVTTPLSNLPTTSSTTIVPPKTVTTLGSDTTPSETYTPSQAQLDCEANGGVWSNGTCTTAPKTDLPTFPNWDTLNCESLKAKISELESTMATSRFAPNVVDTYNSQLAYARSLVSSKCYVTPPSTTTLAPVVGGGVFGGGGGGGFGQEPSTETPQVEEKKSNIGLFLVIGVVGGLYFLLRKKK